MNERWRGMKGMLALVLLGGCATIMQPKVATEAEALRVFGEPVERWKNSDGSTTLEYSTQPMGQTALMITVDGAGKVVRQEDALSDENLARVEPGMSSEQVSHLLGRHRSVQFFRLSGEEVWDWNIRNDGPGIATLFNVHFKDGKVVRTSRSYVYPHDGKISADVHPHYPFYAPYPYKASYPYRWAGWEWYRR